MKKRLLASRLKTKKVLSRHVLGILTLSAALSSVQAADFNYRVPYQGVIPSGTPAGSQGTTSVGSGGSQGALSVNALNFGNATVIGYVSASQTVKYQNTGTTDAHISSIETTGPFLAAYTCSPVLAAGKDCSIQVAFLPVDTSPATGTITVRSDGANSPYTVSLQGTGVQSTLYSTPSALDFGEVPVGYPASLDANVFNKGDIATQLVSVAPNVATFLLAKSCEGQSLAAKSGSSCTVTVFASPKALGPTTGYVEMHDNAGNQARIPLKITGVNAAQAKLSDASLAFDSQRVGTTSAAKTVTLSNTGVVPLPMSGFSLLGDFGATNNCGTTLAVGSSCSFNVTFAPTLYGDKMGKLTIMSEPLSAPLVVNLTGVGLDSDIQAVGDTSFGITKIGTPSVKTLTVSNKGTQASVITGVSLSGNNAVSQSNQCVGLSLSPGTTKTCTVSLTYAPTVMETLSGVTLTITDSLGHVLTKSLDGIGVDSSYVQPYVAPSTVKPYASTDTLDFGFVSVGSPSVKTVALAPGSLETTVKSINVVGDSVYTAANTCLNAKLTPGSDACAMNLTFTPHSLGSTAATKLKVTYSSGEVTEVSLKGSGIAVGANKKAALSSTALTFPDTPVGTAAAENRSVLYQNTGSEPLSVLGISTGTTAYAATHNCPASLNVGASCTINVAFNPSKVRANTDSLTVFSDAKDQPTVASLTGVGTGIELTGAPSAIAFVNKDALSTPTVLTSTITNTGTQPTTLSSVAYSGSSQLALATENCTSATLAPDASCSISVRFTPTTPGSVQGKVHLTATGTSLDVPVTGTTDSVGQATLSTQTVNFNTVGLGSSSLRTVNMANTGPTPLVISGISLVGASDTTAAHNCPGSLAVGTNCAINLTWTPTAVGSLGGILQIGNDGKAGQLQVGLSGVATTDTGSGATDSLTHPTAVSFGDHSVQSTPTKQTVTLSNKDTIPVTMTGVTVTGDSQFSVTSNTCSAQPLAGKASCTIEVQFAPTVVGTASGSLQIATASDSLSIPLGGTGLSIGELTASATNVNFGSLQIQSTSQKSVALQNTGPVPVSIESVTTTKTDITSSHNCPATLALNGTCTVNLSLTPTTAGAWSDSLVIKADTAEKVKTIPLSATVTAPNLAVSTPTLTFSSSEINKGFTQAVAVSNNGTGNGTISKISVAGDSVFAAATDCQNTVLVPNTGSCLVNVTYTPTAFGTQFNGTLSLETTTGQSTSVALTGSSFGASPTFSLNGVADTTFNLGSLQSLTASTQTLTLTNKGNQPLSIDSLTGQGLTVTGGTCATGNSLATNASCTIQASVTPPLVSAETAESHFLTLGYNSGKTTKVTLTDVPFGGWLDATKSYDFGTKTYGGTYHSTSGAVTITNRGTRAVAIDSSTLVSLVSNNADVSATHNCGTSLAAGATCQVDVLYTPGVDGSLPSDVTLTLKSAGLQTPTGGNKGDIFVSIAGASKAAKVSAPATVMYTLAGVPTSQNVTLTNTGSAPAMINSLSVTGTGASQFSVSQNGCSSLTANGGTCQVAVTYTPATGVSTANATLDINFSGGPNSPATASLTGNATGGADASQVGTVGKLTYGVSTAGYTFPSGSSAAAFGNVGITHGKWYMEITLGGNYNGTPAYEVGFTNTPATMLTTAWWPEQAITKAFGAYFHPSGGYFCSYTHCGVNQSTTSPVFSAFSKGDVIGIAIDADNNLVKWVKNNQVFWTTTGITTPKPWYVGVYTGYVASTLTFNFGQSAFQNTIPTGFVPGLGSAAQ